MDLKHLKKNLKYYFKKNSKNNLKVYAIFDIFLWRYTTLRIAEFTAEGHYIKYMYKGSNKSKWKIYYVERNIESHVQYFTSEADACTYFYNWIKSLNFFFWYRRLGRRDISIFGKWKKDFIWEQTQLNFTDASRAMKIVMNIYQN